VVLATVTVLLTVEVIEKIPAFNSPEKIKTQNNITEYFIEFTVLIFRFSRVLHHLNSPCEQKTQPLLFYMTVEFAIRLIKPMVNFFLVLWREYRKV